MTSGATLPHAAGRDMKSMALSIHESSDALWLSRFQIFATLIRSMLPTPVATPR